MSIDYHKNTVRFHAFSEGRYDSRLFSYRFTVGGDPQEGQLVNSRAPELAIYLRTYLCASFHRSGVNRLRARSALVLYEQTRIRAVGAGPAGLAAAGPYGRPFVSKLGMTTLCIFSCTC